MKLKCQNEECPSHKNDEPMFSTHLTVNEVGEVVESVKKIPGDSFECAYCSAMAEWVE